MIYITKRPEKLVWGSETSRWTSLFNPYLFEVTRKDYTAINTLIRPVYHSTLPTVKTNADPAVLPTQISAGQTIFLSSGMYSGAYVVHSVTGNYITINTPYIGVGGAGYVNLMDLLLNFKMYFNIYDKAGTLIESLFSKPNTEGLVMLDVSGAMQKLVDNSDSASLILINEEAEGLSGEFYLGYGYSYKLGVIITTTPEQKDAARYFWTSSAQQITGKFFSYGQNLAQYVPFPVNGSAAKFLTFFEEPTMFIGFPFSISVIYSEAFESTYLARHQQNNDINGVATSAESSQVLNVNGLGFLNFLQLETTDATTSSLDLWLETAGAIPDGGGYYDSGMMQQGYVDQYAQPLPM